MSFFRKPTPLPVQQGGTGDAYFSSGYALIGNGYSALLELTPSTSGNVMTSNGTTWTSAPATGVTKDANGNITVNAVYTGFTNVAAAGTTTTLTAASTPNFVVTGSGGQTYQLPDATTLPNGAIFTFNNNQSSGTIVVKNNSSTTVTTVQSGSYVVVVLLSNSIAAGSWDYHFQAPSSVLWSTNTFSYGGSMSALAFTSTNDSTINGLKVGKGYGSLTYNSSFGVNALTSSSLTGNYNTAIGYGVLAVNTSGAANTALGGTDTAYNTMGANLTGSANSAFGNAALGQNQSGNHNMAIGYQSLYSNVSSSENTAVGFQASYYQTGGINTALGSGALFGASGTSSGINNTAVGYQALQANTTASNNTALGNQAGYRNTTGYPNVFVGNQAGFSNTTSASNVFMGDVAGYYTTGAANTFLGRGAGYFVTSGANNTILGRFNGNQGGLDITTSSNYIVLSDGDGNPRGFFDGSGNLYVATTTASPGSGNTATGSYFGAIGVASLSRASDACLTINTNADGQICRIYRSGSQVGNISVTTATTTYNSISDYRLKTVVDAVTDQGARIDALKPVNYLWTESGQQARGFLAHEFQEVYANSVTGTKDGVDADGNPVYQAMQASTSEIIADLVAEIQSLRQRITALEAK